jgi:O-methyltransferase involved in polyketide biosynthesis
MSRWDRISITAHATAHIWARYGLPGAAAFDTWRGRLLYSLAHPFFVTASALGVNAPHEFCLQRHRLIDALLDRIGPQQVIELACGLSPRCLARARATGVRCIDVDLPDLLRLKASLAGPGRPPSYLQAELDLMAAPDYASALGPALRREPRTVVIAEGLLSYLDLDRQQLLFGRVAALLAACGGGCFLTDVHHQEDVDRLGLMVGLFRGALGVLTRSTPHPMIRDLEQGRAMLELAGFGEVTAHRPADWAGELDLPVRRRDSGLRVYQAASNRSGPLGRPR